MVDLEIRPVRRADAPALVAAGDQERYVRDRLDKQQQELGVFLAAWRDSRAVGSVYLWLEPAEEPEIREHLWGTPLITHLEVFRLSDRNQGVGTRLVEFAEGFLLERGFTQAALAVELTNLDAARLYKGLGYRHWGHGRVECYRRDWQFDGTLIEVPETCDVLVKKLA